MENNNTVDWLAVKAQASDKSFADIYSLGVDPSKVGLEDKDFYKKSKKIQQMFSLPDGTFDDKKFDAFYLDAEKSFNSFRKSDFSTDNVTTDLFSDDSVTRASKVNIRKNPVKVTPLSGDPFTNLKVAQGSFLGVTEINKWSKPDKSLSEVAQSQKVVNGKTGEVMDFTAQDSGLQNLFGFFDEPLVMAQYDEDEKDAQGNITHKKGELKFGKDGLPFYETLAGRDPSGRKLLSRWDTLTKEGSYANKFDFMDSDGLDKSLTGIVVKNAVQLAPFLIGGPISSFYKAFYVAEGLMEGMTEIGKSLDGIMNGPDAKKGGFYKWANDMQGYTGQFKTGMSEKGRSTFWGMENLLQQATDSVYQLMGQKFLAEVPMNLKKYQIAKSMGVDYKDALNPATYIGGKVGAEWLAGAEALSKNMEAMRTMGKYSSYFSTAYMAATSAKSISDSAEMLGLDAKDKGMLYVGFMSALVPLFRSDVGRWVEQGLEINTLSKNIDAAIKRYAAGYGVELAEKMAENTGKLTLKQRGLQALTTGKELGGHIAGLFKNFDVHSTMTAAAAEATEESTEWALEETLKGIYNSLSAFGFKSTQEDLKFQFDPATMAQDLMANAFGGALGGAIFHKLDKNKRGDAFVSNDMMEYIVNGYGKEVIDKINDLKGKGQIASTQLSTMPVTDLEGNVIADNWKPVNTSAPMSQNDFIADKMVSAVRTVEGLMKAYGVNNPTITAAAKDEFYASLVDTGSDTSLRDDIQDVAKQLYDKTVELSKLPGDTKEEGFKAIKDEISILKARLEYLQSDESNDEYFKQGLFNTRKDINKQFGVKDLEDFATEVNPHLKEYRLLSPDDKAKADQLYNEYKSDKSEKGMKADLKKAMAEYERFDKSMLDGGHYAELDLFKQSLIELDKYAVIGDEMVYSPEDGDAPIVEKGTVLIDKYIEGMRSVKYVPDYMYDKIKKKLNSEIDRLTDSQFGPAIGSEGFEGLHVKLLTKDDTKVAFGALAKTKLFQDLVSSKLGKDFLQSKQFQEVLEKGKDASKYSIFKVFKSFADLINPQSAEELKQDLDLLSSIEGEGLYDILDSVLNKMIKGETAFTDTESLVAEILERNGIHDYLDTLAKSPGFDPGDVLDPDIFNVFSFLRGAYFQRLAGKPVYKDLDAVKDTMGGDDIYHNNPFIDIMIKGEYRAPGVKVDGFFLKNLDTTELDNSVQALDEFDKERVPSPLREALKAVHEFVDSEFATLDSIGASNYINASDDFKQNLDDHMKAVKRMAAQIEAVVTLNPLINDFRKNNGDILGDMSKEELFVLDPEDKGYLLHDLSILYGKLSFLNQVNEHNKNNLLSRQLKDRNLHLASRVKTLKTLSSNPEVLKLIPSLSGLYENKELLEFSDSFNTASEALRLKAFYQLTNIEHAINADFRKLELSDKMKVINMTFKPVNKFSPEFNAKVDGNKEYNAPATTAYLATIFGSSSLEFYQRYAGPYDPETKMFANIEKMPFIPLSNQENGVRLANLVIYGDPVVKKALANAYTYVGTDENPDYSKSKSGATAYLNSIAITGWPGTGKSTATGGSIINLIDGRQENVLLLAPAQTRVDGLKASLTKIGLGDRIDKDNSKMVRDFLNGLGIKTSDGKLFDFGVTESMVEKSSDGAKEYAKALQQLIDSLDIYKDKNDETYTLKEEIVNKLSKYNLLLLDEFTHLNVLERELLMFLVDRYNNSSTVKADKTLRLSLVMLGDTNQMGYVNKDGLNRYTLDSSTHGTYSAMIVAPPLKNSLRSGLDVINNTLVDVGERTETVITLNDAKLTSTESIGHIINTPIKASYVNDPVEGNLGINVVPKTGDTTTDQIKFITDNKDKFTGKDVVYITRPENLENAKKLLQSALGDTWINFVDVYSPEHVQGGEYKYAIIDAAPKLNGNEYDIRRTYEFLNTMLSRATKASLLLNDGTYDHFAKFEVTKRDRAITQIKINDKVIETVKEDYMNLMRAILEDFTGEAPLTEEEIAQLPKAEDIAFGDIGVLEQPPVTEAYPKELVERPNHLMSYNSMVSIGDLDALAKLAETTDEDRLHRIANAYKNYVLHKEDIYGDNESLLNSLNIFKPLFVQNDLDYKNPVFYMEVAQRGRDYQAKGRVTFGRTSTEKASDVIFSLKIKVPSLHAGGEPLILNMGYLSDLNKVIELKNKGVRFDIPTYEFLLERFKNAAKATNPETWQSAELSKKDFMKAATVFRSILQLNKDNNIEFNEFKKMYPDFLITQPHVVVANKLELMAYDKKNQERWDRLRGKSIIFVSEIGELSTLPINKLFEYYKLQVETFSSKAFLELPYEEKEKFIRALPPMEVTSSLKIPMKPNLIKMIKVDTPRYSFLESIERFKAEVRHKTFGVGKITEDMFEKFDMTTYVKDRLIKSLLMIYDYLNDPTNGENNRKWFEKHVMEKQKTRSDRRIDAVYELFPPEFKAMKVPLVSEFYDKVRPLDMAEVLSTLKDIIHGTGKDAVIKKKFIFDDTGKVDKGTLVDVTSKDLQMRKLSDDKDADFSTGFMFNINIFNLFKKLKNDNFADMIDIALTVFAQEPPSTKFGLGRIFKDGLMEGGVIAKRDNFNEFNVLAEAQLPPGDSGFKFGLNKLTVSDFSIDFAKFRELTEVAPVAAAAAEAKEVEDRKEVEEHTPAYLKAVDALTEFAGHPQIKAFKRDLVKGTFKDLGEMDAAWTSIAVIPEISGKMNLNSAIDVEFFPGAQALVSTVEDYIKAEFGDTLESLEYVPENSTNTTLVAIATVGGTKFELKVTYDKGKLTMIKSIFDAGIQPDESALKKQLKDIDAQATKAFEDLIKSSGFPETDITKPILEYYRLYARHTIVSANLNRITGLTMQEYDAKLAAVNIREAAIEMQKYINTHALTIKKDIKTLNKFDQFILKYKPTICN